MGEILKTTTPLAALCLIVGLCLSYVNALTKGPIEIRKKEDAERRRKEVLVDARTFNEVLDWSSKAPDGNTIKSIFRGMDGEKPVGYVFSASPRGYGGEMDVIIGISKEGLVTGVKLGENRETPGLGTRAGMPPFITQFPGKKVFDPVNLVKMNPGANDIQAIAGATISSRAVTIAVQNAAHLARVLIDEEKNIK